MAAETLREEIALHIENSYTILKISPLECFEHLWFDSIHLKLRTVL